MNHPSSNNTVSYVLYSIHTAVTCAPKYHDRDLISGPFDQPQPPHVIEIDICIICIHYTYIIYIHGVSQRQVMGLC
jgi:hypothetical protein